MANFKKREKEHQINKSLLQQGRFLYLPYEVAGQLPADHFQQRFGTIHQKFQQN